MHTVMANLSTNSKLATYQIGTSSLLTQATCVNKLLDIYQQPHHSVSLLFMQALALVQLVPGTVEVTCA